MKLADRPPAEVKVWDCQRWIDVLEWSRKILVIHGYVSDAENKNICRRLDKAAKKEGLVKMKITAAIALVACLACPAHAESKFSRFAPITSWIACQGFDAITTAVALHNPQLREANPILRGPVLFPLKLSINLGAFVGHQQISERHPRLRFFAPLVMASSGCLAGVLNMRTIRSVN